MNYDDAYEQAMHDLAVALEPINRRQRNENKEGNR